LLGVGESTPSSLSRSYGLQITFSLHISLLGYILYNMSSNSIETVGFEDISSLIDVCRDELERGGFFNQAEMLRGIEVLDRTGAHVALFTIRSLPKSSSDLDILTRHIAAKLNSMVAMAAA